MATTTTRPRFELGQVVATPGIIEGYDLHSEHDDPVEGMVKHAELLHLLTRHVRLDQGLLDDEDQEANERAVEHGARVFSAFDWDGQKVWVITEADRSVTTILLPSEY